MLDITLITIGKIKDKNLLNIAEEYIKRIKPFARLEILELKAGIFNSSTKEKYKKEESIRIEEILAKRSPANIFLLAEDGVEHDSISFAANLDKINGPIILVIAGALGWDESFRQKYSKISLSNLTMPHELARVVLLEQLYRSALILCDKEYHY